MFVRFRPFLAAMTTLCLLALLLAGVASAAFTPNAAPQTAPASPAARLLLAPPFPAPGGVSGLAFDAANNHILMVSEEAGVLYVIDPNDGLTLQSCALPGAPDVDPGSYGIAIADSFWWHSDYQRSRLYKLAPADCSVLAELPMPTRYLGLAWTGSELWGVSPAGQALYRIDANTGAIVETIALAAVDAPIDLTWDGANLWVADKDNASIHQLDAAGNVIRSEAAPVAPWGLAAQGDYIWLGNYFDAVLHRLDLGAPPVEWSAAYDKLFASQADLALMRRYRDEILAQSAAGRTYTELLYRASDEALAVLLDNPALLARARRLVDKHSQAIADTLNGRQTLLTDTAEIAAFLDAFAAQSPPALALLVKMVKQDMLAQQRQSEPFLGFRLP